MKCMICKNPLTKNDKFCSNCGEPNPYFVLKADHQMTHVEDRATKEWGKDIEYDSPKYFLLGFFQLFKPYFKVSGTMTRKQFWSIQLIILLIDIPFLLYMIQTYLGWINLGLTFSWVRFFIATNLCWFLPLLGAETRRLHDADRSAYWILLKLIPGIGTLIFIYLLTLPSNPQTRYS